MVVLNLDGFHTPFSEFVTNPSQAGRNDVALRVQAHTDCGKRCGFGLAEFNHIPLLEGFRKFAQQFFPMQ
jgi:hypothetical protein